MSSLYFIVIPLNVLPLILVATICIFHFTKAFKTHAILHQTIEVLTKNM